MVLETAGSYVTENHLYISRAETAAELDKAAGCTHNSQQNTRRTTTAGVQQQLAHQLRARMGRLQGGAVGAAEQRAAKVSACRLGGSMQSRFQALGLPEARVAAATADRRAAVRTEPHNWVKLSRRTLS